ncbi:hypothetical protein AVEN_28287-1 [Araneus ventricosus]|uniref:Uncharacterized protein n=1 Tax=Araneus ventricosus TaxID=182803 RepID=A0A4Y2US95_ARAVE|nr:hypothetical protein AVEN_28287-1 [Araneus ventricosus]
MRPRCIKCNVQHATWECSANERNEDPVCINCGVKGHLSAWKGCKALPVIKKPSIRQPGKSYSADTKRKEEKTVEKNMETTSDEVMHLTDLEDSLQAPREVKILLQEFPTLLEATRRCRQGKTKQEKALIVLSALMCY